jgi:hypothetical protein
MDLFKYLRLNYSSVPLRAGMNLTSYQPAQLKRSSSRLCLVINSQRLMVERHAKNEFQRRQKQVAVPHFIVVSLRVPGRTEKQGTV